MKSSYDCVVLGAGPAGSAAALEFSRSGASVLLAERSRFDLDRLGEMLPPPAAMVLGEIGAPGVLAQDSHWPVWGIVSEWASEEPDVTDFICSPFGHGWSLDRRRFDERLAKLAAQSGAELWVGAEVTSFERNRSEWRLSINGQPITASFLVDATGRAGFVARRCGSEMVTRNRMIGLAGVWSDAGEDHWTRIRAVKGGWWYTAILPGGRRLATFFTDIEECRLPQGMTWREVWRSFEDTAPVAIPAKVLSFWNASACSAWREQVYGDGWVAVGDAALAKDPLSASGICWALESGVRAAVAVTHDAMPSYSGWVAEQCEDYCSALRRHYALAKPR